MKKNILLLLAIIPLFVLGQEKENISNNSSTNKGTPNELKEEVAGVDSLQTDSTGEYWINCKSKPKGNALVLINGLHLQEGASLFDIDTIDIVDISVIKEKEKLIKYGDEGKNGVIEVKVKDIDKYRDLLKEEYETIVLAPGFESFVTTQPSKPYFTESWLKSKNAPMVTEWNYRHGNPSQYNPSIYEEVISYDNKIDYGLDVEYTLYMFFRFMEKENNMSLIGDRQITQR